MAEELQTSTETENVTWRGVVGVALVLGGGLMLIDQLLKLGWLAPLSVLTAGIYVLLEGLRNRSKGFLIAGAILFGLGLGIAFAFDFPGSWSTTQQIGMICLFGGIGFGVIEFLYQRIFNKEIWWPIIPMAILFSVGMCLLLTPPGILDLVLFVSVGLSAAFLWIGLTHHWIGFIIPGCLLLTTGLGIYIPWGTNFGTNPLSKTGGMLVLFAFGWGLITVFSKMISDRFMWWPLIPGGLLAVVGWGLYTGGDPGNAVKFISNTGTIAIMMLGFYLMMMRRGIR